MPDTWQRSTAPVSAADNYVFSPEHLDVANRPAGISAFIRTRNGAAFIEQAVRSHIDHFDEIVAVHNRCTDATPEILNRLAQEFFPRLRVIHYVPSVYPPGSDGHRTESFNSPLSYTNYNNLALAETRFRHVTKLDDDHIAMPGRMAKFVADVRAGRTANNEVACFSGFNFARDRNGGLGVLRYQPFAGSGDCGIYPVGPETYFHGGTVLEGMKYGGMTKTYHSLVFWHLKYLKPANGFGNYDLTDNPNSRYHRHKRRFESNLRVADMPQFIRGLRWSTTWREWVAGVGIPLSMRDRLIVERRRDALRTFGKEDIATLIAGNSYLASVL